MASVAAHHAEWLSLMEVSGPFLSVPVLQEALPNGLDAHDPLVAAELRAGLEQWADPKIDAWSESAVDVHMALVRFVLAEVLEFDADVLLWGADELARFEVTVQPHGTTLAPDAVVLDGGKPTMLVSVVGPGLRVDEPVPGDAWPANSQERMVEHLKALDCRLGLVTDGERWTLVTWQEGENAGFATWWSSFWLEERVTLQAFRTLLRQSRFVSEAPPDTLAGLLARSAADQREITTKLGDQTLDAVEILVRTIDQIDRDRAGSLLRGVDEAELYDAAVTVMMRLIFLFFAEENDLLPMADPLYVNEYAASTLRSRLQESADEHGEEVLETTHDGWPRLLATWRAVFGGVEHSEMVLAPYGGSLFDPDRYPFLEGRLSDTSWIDTAADPLPIDNRTVLHLLNALQTLHEKGHRRKLSFRALDVEQIGHVYEGMLDHTAVRAQGWVLGLSGTGGKEPEISLEVLEDFDGGKGLLDLLKDRTGRSVATLKSWLSKTESEKAVAKFAMTWSSAFSGDVDVSVRARPFARLIREDSTGAPAVFHPGSVYVTDSSHRGATGTHYTPRSLTEEIVRHTLDPLVYEGPAEGKTEHEWLLRSPAQILNLKVCDPACGSGAFLVQACRYLAEKLVEARRVHGDELTDPNEADLINARREVAESCIHGVDINPMACEMAKLSLWLITLAKDLPFTFVDHAIRQGDSLLGTTSIDQVRRFSLRSDDDGGFEHRVRVLIGDLIKDSVTRALRSRELVHSFPTVDLGSIEKKHAALREADHAMAQTAIVADRIVAETLAAALDGDAVENRLLAAARHVGSALDAGDLRPVRRRAAELLERGRPATAMPRQPMHWPLEFPHVFLGDGTGFDAIVGNPPFVGGQRLTGAYGADYREYLVDQLAWGVRGSADLVAYFFLRAASLTNAGGAIGLLATNTIGQGDTREVGLDQLTKEGWTISRAVRSQKWPGQANLEIAKVWLARSWIGAVRLDDLAIPAISTSLRPASRVAGHPQRLSANSGGSFIGSYVLGLGFVLEPEEALSLIETDDRNREVLYPYLNGKDLNSKPDQSASRWVINFFDWPVERAKRYPGCFKIIEDRVRPERQRMNEKGKYVLRRPLPDKYWIYAEKRPALYAAIADLGRVLVLTRVSTLIRPAWVPVGVVMSEATVVFPYDDDGHFGLLTSDWHWWWAARYASTMRTDTRYTPSDCFETFAMPLKLDGVTPVGAALNEHRAELMLEHNEGLTKTYNRFNDEADESVAELRQLHVELDHAVRDAYGWSDLTLDHGFWLTDYGMKFTVGPETRQEMLDRLLDLNHQRYAGEVAEGLHPDAPSQLAFER